MSANSNLDLTSLDFTELKASLKAFLAGQTRFKDYNFDGSNLSVLLDVLSFNTYINSFNLNMVASEMFLDSAQLHDSIVSHAKELGYLPRSFRSSQATVSITLNGNDSSLAFITIPSGTTFTGKSGGNNYTFQTGTNIVVPGSNAVFVANGVVLTEGSQQTDTFLFSVAQAPQLFTLSNPTVDTDTLTVVSIENNGSNVVPYSVASSLLDLSSNSSVFFIQAGENNQYQFFFGDGTVGRIPQDGAVIVASYLSGSGELPNGIQTFVADGPIGGISNIVVTTLTSASGGAISETDSSIKFYAPRSFATQDRGVAAPDYEILLKNNFPEISAIHAFGGEEMDPPDYGKVYIALQISGFAGLPQSKIQQYSGYLSTRSSLGIIPILVSPSYLYASVTTTVGYNVNSTDVTDQDINTFVTGAIQDFSANNLSDFGVTLRYSQLCASIDTSHASILSDDTEVLVMLKVNPVLAVAQNISVSFNTALEQYLVPETRTIYPAGTPRALRSSSFLYNGQTVFLEDDGAGTILVVRPLTDGNHILFKTGTVDYTNGNIQLSNFVVQSYFGDSIRFYGKPASKDIQATLNVILEIPNDEISVTVVPIRM
jgi:Straboviridae baseplate wedge protein Gp6